MKAMKAAQAMKAVKVMQRPAAAPATKAMKAMKAMKAATLTKKSTKVAAVVMHGLKDLQALKATEAKKAMKAKTAVPPATKTMTGPTPGGDSRFDEVSEVTCSLFVERVQVMSDAEVAQAVAVAEEAEALGPATGSEFDMPPSDPEEAAAKAAEDEEVQQLIYRRKRAQIYDLGFSTRSLVSEPWREELVGTTTIDMLQLLLEAKTGIKNFAFFIRCGEVLLIAGHTISDYNIQQVDELTYNTV
jgi:protein-disulfide isomerase